jgi:hypothetical protein
MIHNSVYLMHWYVNFLVDFSHYSKLREIGKSVPILLPDLFDLKEKMKKITLPLAFGLIRLLTRNISF